MFKDLTLKPELAPHTQNMKSVKERQALKILEYSQILAKRSPSKQQRL
mgnify:CR=1|jgi:hypothetical protein